MQRHPSSRRGFLRGLSGTALAAIVDPVSAAETVPAPRLARLSSGTNVCKWFRYPKSESPEHFSTYLTAAEIDMMAAMGIRHVRLCVHPRVLMDQQTGALLAPRAALLEAAIRKFHAADLLVVVDMHNEDRTCELDPRWQDAFVRFWGELAGRLAPMDPGLTMFEVINEPVFAGRAGEWAAWNSRLVGAIRAAAPSHTILTSGAEWGGVAGLKKLQPLADKNVVYSFHSYDPFPFTHQGATWAGDAVKPLRQVPYPSSPEAVAPLLPGLQAAPGSRALIEKYGNDRWNREKLAARFQEAVDWGAMHQVPLYCGEFGVYDRHVLPAHRAHWFRDFAAVLRARRIGWAVWGWDEGFGLRREFRDGKPVVDNVVATALGWKVINGQ